MNTIIQGDALIQLKTLPSAYVQTVITSPPYFGLRDYGTAQWEGGNPECDHLVGRFTLPASEKQMSNFGSGTRQASTACPKCGATRQDQQIGLEDTPEAYIARLVEVFREVRRVLRDDGTLWVNIGDSYAGSWGNSGNRPEIDGREATQRSRETKVFSREGYADHRSVPPTARLSSVSANFLNSLESFTKGYPLIFRNATTIGITAKRGDIPLHDNGFPYGILLSLLGIERVTIKQRDNNFCQVFNILNKESYCWICCPVISYVVTNDTDVEIVLDAVDGVSIVISNLDTNIHPVLRVLSSGSTGASKERDSSLPVKETHKPVTKCIRDIQPIGDTITFDTPLKRFPDIYLVDDAIALRDGFDTSPSYSGNFRITQATLEQFSFSLGNCGIDIRTSLVAHMFTPNSFGSLVRYTELYDKAKRKSNAQRAKQEFGIPFMLRQALMEDGWICRSTIIWSKPNCMPESVTDRPTKAHEYIFLLSKNERYYYDADAIREPLAPDTLSKGGIGEDGYGYVTNRQRGIDEPDFIQSHPFSGSTKPGALRHINPAGRNKRSVWTVSTMPFSGTSLLADYVGDDGKPYIRSEDCPVHGQRRGSHTLKTGGYDAQQDHTLVRKSDMSSYPAQEPSNEFYSIPSRGTQDFENANAHMHNHESIHDNRSGGFSGMVVPQIDRDIVHTQEIPAYSSDYQSHPYAEIAIDRSTESHKMGLSPVTNPACMPSVETASGILDTSELPLWSGLDGYSGESNIKQDGLSGHPLGRTEHRNTGKSSGQNTSLAYVHGNIAKCTCQVVSIDHFATFPPKLIEPCVLAGSRPGDIVLDCFMGAGTVALVSIKHGRNYLGIELNPVYVQLAEKRIRNVQMGLWTTEGIAV